MKTIAIGVLMAFTALLSAAEDHQVQKIVPVTRGDPTQVFATAREVLREMPLRMTLYQNTIVLNGNPDAVAAAETLIHNLESAAPRDRDIEIQGYIIVASAQGDGSANLPPDLAPVVKQFHNLLSYKSFHVLDTLILRIKENSDAQSRGILTLPNTASTSSVTFHAFHASVTDDVIHIKALDLSVRTPIMSAKGQETFNDIGLSTAADVKSGQKVAIGKASINPAGDALILVVSAKVVD